MIGLDLGSNTLRGVRIDCTTFERIAEYEKIIKTADRLHETKIINNEAIKRVIDAIFEAKERLGFDNDKVVAVATAALRMAKNQQEVLERIKEQTSIEFEVISGEDEAYYVAYAVKKRLESMGENRDFMLIDIGGGSTEIIFWSDNKLISQSFDVGIVTIAQKYVDQERISSAIKKDLAEAAEFIQEMRLIGHKPPLFIATAGTPTTIAAMMQGMDYESYDYKRINGYILKKESLKRELNRLVRMSIKERERFVGVGRADVIIAGVLMFEYIFEKSGYNECMTIDDGLREGVALFGCKKLKV